MRCTQASNISTLLQHSARAQTLKIFKAGTNDKAAVQGMVPRSDLIAAAAATRADHEEMQARAGEIAQLEEQLARAKEQLRASRAQVSKLEAAAEEMVPRADLMSAMADARVAREEAAARAAEKAETEEQLGRLQRQLRAAQAEAAAHAQTTLDEMVPKVELAAARARADDAEQALRLQTERQNEAMESLKERFAALQRENDKLIGNLQVALALTG